MLDIYIITATTVIDTGKISFKFMGKAPHQEFREISNQFGSLITRPYGKNEFNPFSAMQGGPALGKPWTKTAPERIELTIAGTNRGIIFQLSMDKFDDGMLLIKDIDDILTIDALPEPGFVLLTERRLYDGVLAPMFNPDTGSLSTAAKHRVFHYDGELSTS